MSRQGPHYMGCDGRGCTCEAGIYEELAAGWDAGSYAPEMLHRWIASGGWRDDVE